MSRLLPWLLVVFGAPTSFASDLPTKKSQVPLCVFENVVGFGASVTQSTPALIPGYQALVWGAEMYEAIGGEWSLPGSRNSPIYNYTSRGYGPSPVEILVKDYLGWQGLKNINYIGAYFTQSENDLGSAQVQALLHGDKVSLYEQASLLVGFDAFYWDAIHGNCGGDAGVESIIRELIERSKSRGQTLILGTVPFENPATVRIASVRTGVHGLWYAPEVKCAARINDTLHQFCHSTNGCYLVDLKAAVGELRCGKKLRLRNGEAFGLFEMRPDGVHMSDVGSRFLAEMAMDALEKDPPSCNAPSSPVH